MSDEQLAKTRQLYEAGRDAFERGSYRQSVESLEKANGLVNRTSRLGGEVQIWLVNAYQANGQQQEAIALCKLVSRHPDYNTAKQGKRLLYILEAPKLKSRPEWMTTIPDLGTLDDAEGSSLVQKYAANRPRKRRSPQSKPTLSPEPINPGQINTKDNGFVWLALIITAATLAGLFLLS
jgi:hypothetical protein